MKYKLSDLVDVDRLQELMDDFYQVTEAPTAILEADGTVLTATGWQPICTEFHRVCPEMAARCAASDAYIADHLADGEPYAVYECANGLVDVAAPIIVEGEHIGTVFTGQFLFEEPDVERFRKQAQAFDLDEDAYLAALADVPIVSRERLEPLLTYLSKFAEMLADVGLEQLKLERLEKNVVESESKLRAIFSAMPDIVMVLDRDGRYVEIAPTNPDLLYKPSDDLEGQLMHDVLPAAAADAYLEQIRRVLDSGEPEDFEYTLPVQSGEVTFFATITPLTEDRVVWVARDISERKQAEAERERFTDRLSIAAKLAERVNTILDPDQLLPEVVAELQERFDLYHVHIYLLERPPADHLKLANAKEVTHIMRQRNLVMSAGSGEVGQKLLKQGHSIPLHREKSLVARAARSQVPVLVNDTSQAPDFMPNPLLPDTKSEISVPLIAGEEVFGVLDVQDSQPNRFSQSDVDVLSTLAGQIATSLRNAQIFEAEVEAEAEARRSAAQRQALLNAIPDMMFHFDSDGIFLDYKAETGAELMAPPEAFLGHHVSDVLPPPLAKMTLEHLEQALQTGEPVTYEYRAPVGDEMRDYEARLTPSGDGEVLALIRDITERKQAEIELRLLSGAVQQSVEGIAISDLEGNLTYVNQAWADMHGYTVEELLGKHLSIFHTEQQLREEVAPFNEKARQTGSYQGEVGHMHKDGSTFPTLMSSTTLTDESGAPVALVGTVRDITEQKQAEMERERFTTRLNTAAAISEQVGSILDPDELLETVIPLIKEQFGLYYVHVYTLDEESDTLSLRAGYGEAGEKMLAEGHSIPLDREASLVATAARTQEPVLVDDVTEDPNFMPNPLLPETKTEVAVPAIAGGKVLGVFDVQHDETNYFTDADMDVFQTLAGQIANAFQSAELLEESEDARDQAQRYLELVGSIIVAIDAEGKITLINRAGCELLGYKEEELIGRDWFATALPEAAQEEVRGIFAQIMAGDIAPVEEYDSSVVTKEGEERILSWHNSLLRDDQGNIVGTLSSAEDITERLRAEQAMRESQQNMRTIFDSVYDAVFIHEMDGSVVDVNEQMLNLYGVTREQALTLSIVEDYSAPENPLEELEKIWADVSAGKVIAFEWIARRPNDGTQFDAQVVLRKISLQDRDVILANIRDITERKQAEAERERFIQRLDIAAQISEQVGSILDPDELLETVIPLIKEQFGLYYVHVYTLDEESDTLSLRAGYGEAGEKMLAEGHSIPLDREASLVATAARTQEPVLVDDVTEDPNFMPNPLLPETKTEVAVPAIAGGKVLGVFDVQHDETNYFTDADLDVFQTLAAQIANAFRSAQLFAQVEFSETRFRDVIASTTDWIWEVDEQGQYVYVSENVEQVLGYTPDEMLGKTAFDFMLPEEVERIGPVFNELVANQRPIENIENWNYHKDGHQVCLVTNGIPMLDEAGNLVGYRGVDKDVTASKKAEAALRESQIKFQTVADYTYDWEYWLGPEDEFLYVSPACEKITGYTVEEFMENPHLLDEIVHPDDRKLLHHHMHAYHENPAEVATAEEAAETEFRIVTKDGNIRWIGHASQPVYGPEGEWLGRRVSNRDATEAVKARESLAQNEERLSLALESGRVGIWEFWPQKNEVYYNPTWYTMLGYEPNELPQELSTWAELLHPDDAERASGIVMNGVQTGEDFHLQFRMKAKEGDWRWIQAHGYVTELTPEGAAERTIGTHTDITERKLAEMERERFTQRLDTAARISEQVGSILNPDELLETVIPLIKEQFGLYYVHVYTLDEESDTLSLRAGYGEAGETMLAEGHSIPLDREASLVATAARTRDPVLVDDVTEDPNFMPNPLLPETKTEVAVPAIAGGKVLGVFDVQHDETNYFTDADVDVFTTLAAQIANAFQTAELYETAEDERAFYDGIIENLPVGVWAVDNEFTPLLVNPAGRAMMGREVQDKAGGTYVEDYEVINIETGELYDNAELPLVKAVTQGGEHTAVDIGVRHPDGTVVPQLINAAPLYDAEGEQRGGVVIFVDATEQHKAEEALREAEAQQRAILETTPVGISITSASEGNVLYVNPEFTDILGYSAEDVLHQVVPNFYASQEEADATFELLQAQNGVLNDHEIRAVRADGAEIWLSLSFQPLEYGGQPASLAAFVDITERKQAEAERERLTTIISNSTDLIGYLDMDAGVSAYINTAGWQMMGYDQAEDVLGKPLTFFHPPEDVERMQETILPTVLAEGEWRGENHLLRKDGSSLPVEQLLFLMHDEQQDRRLLATFMIDITDRLAAERERERFTTRLNTAAQISEQVGSILDPDELLETVIPLIKEQFGLYYVHVYTLDGKSGTLNLRAGYGEAGETMLAEGHSIPLDREASLVARAARTQEPVLVDDVTENPNFMPNPLLPDTKTEVAVPSIAGGKVLGVFDVQHDEPHYFTRADVDVFTTLAGQIANAFRSAELFEQAERNLRETEVRLQVSQALAGIDTPDQVWHTMLEQSGIYPHAGVGLYAIEEENDEKIMVTQAFDSFDTGLAEEPVGTRFPADEFEVTALVADGEQVIIDNIFTDNRMGAGMQEDARKLGYVSLAATPISAGNTIIGVIVAHSPEEAYFDEAKLNLYATLADQGSVALEAARLQQAIRENQIKFQTVADYTYDWEYWLGPEDEFLYVSPACEKITGHTADEFMENPHLLDEIVHPDDRDALHHHMHAYHENPVEVATAEDAAETEFRIVTKDGNIRWIGHACQPVYGPEGEWLGRRASNRDATEAVKARESLAQNEERLSLALESGRVGIWEFWPQRDEVYYNPTYYTMLGYEPYELPQDLSTWSGLMHPDDVERANATVMSSIQTGEDFHLQFRMHTKEGDWLWIQAHGYVTEHTPEGSAERVIGTHTDITERKLAEAEQARLSAVLEATTDFVGIATPDGNGVYFNQAAREMVGIPSDADPSKYEIVSFTPERELERTQEKIIPTAIQEGAWTGESFIRTSEGEEIPVLMTIISITDEAGNLRYLANIARDITDIRAAREAQARFAAQLSTAAEIAARVNAVLDPDELFNMVIPLTKERFDLYHVHFYAFDPESEMLNLRAGYGRAGELMLRQGHKIPFDRERSIVARAARDRELVVINDVAAEPDHLPNMLLPDTKSEVAVPAIVGDELLGVLDVQADEADFFTASDLDVYRTLVGQIATAYQNARYFERQRESESALRESAEKIRAIFNAITDGISVTNMTGEITDLNEALLDLHGYEQRDELLGRNTMELIARDDWPTATQNINHTLDTGSSRDAEMLLVRQGGAVFDGEVSTALLQDDEGNPTGIISVVRDITQRKRREAALRLTRASVDNAEDEIFWFDDEGNFFDVNRAACEILGYTREELLGMQVFDVDPDFPEEAWPELLAQVRDKGAITLTSQHMTKDGVIFPVEVTVNYLKFGDQEFIFSFSHDITERQQVEKERQRFTTQLRTAAEVAAQINAILDPQELLAEVVPMVQERFDLYHVHVYILDEETNELVMRVGTGEAGRVMLEEGHKIALDRAKSLVARSARSRQPVLVNDVTQDPDFMPNPLLPDTKSEVAVPAVAGDRVIGIFDVQDDEPNRFAESDLDVFTTLASQIAIAFQNAQYFEEVQRTAERLREVDRLKGEFLANMSHELRTPLNSILGYTEVILMGIDGPLNDEMTEDVDAIHKNGKHLLRLINDILDLTKIEAGRLKLEQEEVYLAPLFDDVRTNNMGYFHKQKTDIDFRVKVFDEDMRVYADRVRLTQILNNLVSNAAKFTDDGFVEMRAYREDDWVCMEVEDTGIGIEDDDLETVFERFRQVDGSNARRAEGTGLGLAITKHLVEMHGGHLEVHSEPGKGSIFSAYFPAYDAEAEAAEEDPTE